MAANDLLKSLEKATHQKSFEEIYALLNGAPIMEKGSLFESFLEFLYKGNGWLVKREAGKHDLGADLLLYHPESPDKPTFVIQAKNHKLPLTFDDTKIELIKFEDQASLKFNCHNYALICLNGFVENARTLAEFNMALFDFEKIKSLVCAYKQVNLAPSLELSAHNLETSEKIKTMFKENSRVAVVQATGTGKSYIVGQAFIETMPDACVFLAPSNFILENQQKLLPWRDKISYMTYAKAANITKKTWLSINPKLIVLDEFHRAGAKVWGEGVKNLIELFPKAKVLGTSATPIRFLDNQRNMVDELFEGSVANEITLHDAIARSILPNPHYVSGLYSINENIEEYKQAIENCKATDEQKSKNLDELKKIKIDWEQSSGIPQILNKHLAKLTGKYIVFCEDIDHLDEMQIEVNRWFMQAGRIRQERINRTDYLVHSDNTEAENNQQLHSFENADSEKSVHILLSVNMLNEGLHIRHVNSVILLRKTTSPIIYLQQLGRCLQVGSGIKPVVFDLVSNISNLGAHSFQVGLDEALEKENEKRINVGLPVAKIKLDIHDETITLTQRLEVVENELGLKLSSFEFWYGLLEEFVKENGHCKVTIGHKTDDGHNLGQWVASQRSKKETLAQEYRDRLDKLGFVWDPLSDQWEEGFRNLEAFKNEHGHFRLPKGYLTTDGFNVFEWVSTQRKNKEIIYNEYKYRFDRLDKLGFVWDPLSDKWEEGFRNLEVYKKVHGHCKVTDKYKTDDGHNLCTWVKTQRSKKDTLSQEYIDRLDNLGFVWDPFSDQWDEGFRYLEAFKNEHGHCKIPSRYCTDDGYNLGTWITNQRSAKDTLLQEFKDRLDKLGFVWDRLSDKWEEGFRNLEAFKNEHGHCKVPRSHITDDGYNLGNWVNNKRKNKDKLSQDYIDQLDKLGFVLDIFSDLWEEGFRNLEAFINEHGHCIVPKGYMSADGFKLGGWVGEQRKKKDTLSQEYIDRLEKLGFVCDPFADKWEKGFRNLEAFKNEHGHCKVTVGYKTDDGYNLGNWVSNLKIKKDTISRVYKDRLDKLGFVWNPLSDQWEEGFRNLEAFKNEHGHCIVPKVYMNADGYKLGGWVGERRKKKDTLPQEYKDRLDKLGFVWKVK